MKFLIDTYKNTGTLHHAYLLEGGKEEVMPPLLAFLEDIADFSVRGNPDFWTGEYESLGIDDARTLRDMQMRKSFEAGRGRKVFIVSATTITNEAQNALLKSFEEPTAGTHFFIIMPSSELLLPTLQSRLVIIPAGEIAEAMNSDEKNHPERIDPKEFLASTKAERLSMLETIIEEKDRTKAAAFLAELEQELHAQIPADTMTGAWRKQLNDFLKIKSYIYDRSASVKMILEYCAVSLPVLK